MGIRININQSDSTATNTIPLWSELPPVIYWLIHDNSSNTKRLYNGKCTILVHSLASLAEGFLTELLLSELAKGTHPGKEKLVSSLSTSGTWKLKIMVFDQLFPKQLSDLKNAEAVESLISLRNNIAHGRTFTEELTYHGENDHHREILSPNYASPKQYLVKLGIIIDRPDAISPTVYWNIAVIQFYYTRVKQFLHELLTTPGITDVDTLRNELHSAYEGDNYPLARPV